MCRAGATARQGNISLSPPLSFLVAKHLSLPPPLSAVCMEQIDNIVVDVVVVVALEAFSLGGGENQAAARQWKHGELRRRNQFSRKKERREGIGGMK